MTMKFTTADGVEVDVIEPTGTSVIDGIATDGTIVLCLAFVHPDGSTHGYQLTATKAFELYDRIGEFGRSHSDPTDDS
jgi:hypothetical protein